MKNNSFSAISARVLVILSFIVCCTLFGQQDLKSLRRDIMDSLKSQYPQKISSDALRQKKIECLHSIVKRRPETKALADKYITLLKDKKSTYNLNWEMQDTFYSEPDFVKLIIEQQCLTELNVKYAYTAYSALLFGDDDKAIAFREKWNTLASTKAALNRLPKIELMKIYPKLYKVRNCLSQIESELLKQPEYRKAGALYWKLWADEIGRKTELMKSSPEYLAYCSSCRKNMYPGNDDPLTIAWQKVQDNDPVLKTLRAERKIQADIMIKMFQEFLDKNPTNPAVQEFFGAIK